MREICSYPRLIHARTLIGLLECFFFVAKEKELWPFRSIRVGRRIAARTALGGRGLAAAAPPLPLLEDLLSTAAATSAAAAVAVSFFPGIERRVH